MKLDISRRDAGRILSLVSERRRKLERGKAKFGEHFDPTLGQNITDGLAAFTQLERVIHEALNPRSPGRDPGEHEGRRDAPGDYRPARQQADET